MGPTGSNYLSCQKFLSNPSSAKHQCPRCETPSLVQSSDTVLQDSTSPCPVYSQPKNQFDQFRNFIHFCSAAAKFTFSRSLSGTMKVILYRLSGNVVNFPESEGLLRKSSLSFSNITRHLVITTTWLDSGCPALSISVCLSVCLCLHICLPISLSLCLSVCVSVCLSIYVCVSVCPSAMLPSTRL